MHRRRYSAFASGSGRGGKLDFGSRNVLDHDARRSRVEASIVALWATGRVEGAEDADILAKAS